MFFNIFISFYLFFFLVLLDEIADPPFLFASLDLDNKQEPT
jgi:hypothetical protein